MRASGFEFRFRMAIIFIVIALGFWSPWIEAWGWGERRSLLEWLALEFSRLGLLRFTDSTPAVIVLGSLLAAFAAVVRIWGTAYLGPGVVQNAEMKAGAVVASGPYRYVRNPLYIGTWCMVAAMAFVMPPTGALFAVVLLTIFLFRLILAEEAFLGSQLGDGYQAYLHAVPRLLPRLRNDLPAVQVQPRWARAIFCELNAIGVFVTLAVLSWRYDHLLMIKGILVSFGLSLLARAALPGSPGAKSQTA